jgi:predicted component of type VI protein secretion system
MAAELNGELVPVGGGDPIPLLRPTMSLGRRASCDICLEFPNISGKHCEFSYRDGYWTVRDLNSANGTKVNGNRITKPQPLKPGDEVAIAKRKYTVQYATDDATLRRLDEMVAEPEEIWGTSLLEKAGLMNPRSSDARHHESRRINLEED